VTAAASAHVRAALGDKAFDEAPSRGLALTLGNAVASAENRLREAPAAIKRNESIRATDVNHTTTRSSVSCESPATFEEGPMLAAQSGRLQTIEGVARLRERIAGVTIVAATLTSALHSIIMTHGRLEVDAKRKALNKGRDH
jgi:hypothetical protein